MIKEGFGHHPHSLRDPTPIADFIVASQSPVTEVAPSFTGNKMRKTWYYGVNNDYRDFPSEKTQITCRGPLFSECYRRYEFELKGVQGSVTIIAPKTEGSGKPWVYRAGFVDRSAAVDLALLAKGYHIVTGPIPYNADGPLKPDWDAVYQYLVGVGFAAKPVMEGAGGAAGVVYAWAVQNPDKVSCIYAENPYLRGAMSLSPLVDHLEPLAKAGVALIDVCGSVDPGIADNARAVESKYKDLGGKITVIVKEGQGHYPLAPYDPSTIVDLIVNNNH